MVQKLIHRTAFQTSIQSLQRKIANAVLARRTIQNDRSRVCQSEIEQNLIVLHRPVPIKPNFSGSLERRHEITTIGVKLAYIEFAVEIFGWRSSSFDYIYN